MWWNDFPRSAAERKFSTDVIRPFRSLTGGKTVNLRKHRLCLFDRATHSGVKLALKINAIADLIQRVVDDAHFVFCEFHEHAPILYHLVN